MNIDDLIAQFRREADDRVAPYLWSDEDLTAWFDEAEEEAAIRARLLYETSNPALCQVNVTASVHTYPLHAAMAEVTHAYFVPSGGTERIPLTTVDRDELDRIEPRWRERTDTPRYLIQDDTAFRLAPLPNVAGVVSLEGYRLPLQSLEMKNTPEISKAHHRHLVDWALFRAFSKPDAETIDPDRAEKAEKRFNAHFGLPVDADMRRATRHNRPQFNKAYW